MKPGRWILYGLGIVAAGLGFGAGLKARFGEKTDTQSSLAYGAVAILTLTFVAATSIYMRVYGRHRHEFMDEFIATKTRYAAQSGLIVGACLMVVMALTFFMWPQLETTVLLWTHTENSGFSFGRLLGSMPFLIGALIGQVVAWLKYR
jgi:hypothetical protein